MARALHLIPHQTRRFVMANKQSDERKHKDTESLQQRPEEPGRKRPSERGVGAEHSTPPPEPDDSPTNKTSF